MAYENPQTGSRELAFGPPPPGFDMGPLDTGGRDPASLGERGVCWWLSDTHVDLTGGALQSTNRLIQQVTATDGLQSAANFEIVFNPLFEQVTIHAILVHRNGQTRDAANPAAFEVMRRELNLERAMYDGRLTAHMIIPDVRVGDMVETCYSIRGAPPVLKGRFSHFVRLQWASPTMETRYRLTAPAGRALKWTLHGDAPEPEDRTEDGVRHLQWRLTDAPPHRHEPDAPSWWIGFASLHVGDDMAWSDVADLFREAYAPGALPSDLAAEVEAISARFEDPAAQVVEALRLVQREIRYHSVGIGSGGFLPRAIETIWATRYGDCKDVSRMLAALLRHLGLDGCPALVNTREGAGLRHRPPGATAFDHCIVRVRLNERTYWLDPTFSQQMGRLDRISQAPDEWALPLEANARLEQIPRRLLELLWDAEEHWRFARRINEPAELTIRSVYALERADDMRRWLANDGREGVARRMREALEEDYGELTESEPLGIIDDPAGNTVEMVERYAVSRPFSIADDGQSAGFITRDDLIGPNFRTPESARRREPIMLGAPRRMRVRRLLDFPVTVAVTPWSEHFTGPGVKALNRFEWVSERQGRHTLDLAIEQPWVEAVDAPDYFSFVRAVRRNNGFATTLPVRRGRIRGVSSGRSGWISWLVVLGLAALFALWRSQGGF